MGKTNKPYIHYTKYIYIFVNMVKNIYMEKPIKDYLMNFLSNISPDALFKI